MADMRLRVASIADFKDLRQFCRLPRVAVLQKCAEVLSVS